jgi:hypothetical protein
MPVVKSARQVKGRAVAANPESAAAAQSASVIAQIGGRQGTPGILEIVCLHSRCVTCGEPPSGDSLGGAHTRAAVYVQSS